MLYFAYGSNMPRTYFRDRCPDSEFRGKALLKGYRIDFLYRSTSWPGGGAADIVKEPTFPSDETEAERENKSSEELGRGEVSCRESDAGQRVEEASGVGVGVSGGVRVGGVGGVGVWGILYNISANDLKLLDQYEDVEEGGYRRIEVEVLHEGNLVKALSYEVVDKLEKSLKPKSGYLKLMVEAAERNRFPHEYIAEIIQVSNGNNMTY